MRNKYGNTKVNGFDSKREAKRYKELQMLEAARQIKELRRQVRFRLIDPQYEWSDDGRTGKCIERQCDYIADFVYEQDGKTVVEDCKGFRTPEYVIKRKLMLSLYGIRIKET